ncbi:hypothetical protein WBP07_22860 (plasmid) [Novosphingobium sp. BL-8A]|uniref:hypothetical protein n=1 Tax=Novosphingobium sp. BL-8A TaxID=3127639 RepID=UPI003756F98B
MMHYKGVRLESRHNLQAELSEMRRVVDAFSPMILKRVQSIRCDSQKGAHYSISILPGPWDESIATGIASAFMTQGGYNGIEITCGQIEVFLVNGGDKGASPA